MNDLTLDDCLKIVRKQHKLLKLSSVYIESKELEHCIAITLSMTQKERHHPGLVDMSRAKRIALGCGCEPRDVIELVRQFLLMRDALSRAHPPRSGP